MTVYELNREQIDELKSTLFWQEYDEDFPMPEAVQEAEYEYDIPDWTVYQEYEDYSFSVDDFSCTAFKYELEELEETKIDWSDHFYVPETDENITIGIVFSAFLESMDQFDDEDREYCEHHGITLFDLFLLQEVSATNLVEVK